MPDTAKEQPISSCERFRRVLILAHHAASNFAYFRAASSLKDEPSLPEYDDIRARIANNFLDTGVTEWCKLFVERERHSWQRYLAADQREGFRDGLLATVGMTMVEWDTYVLKVLTYRDKFLAHLDSLRVMNTPLLDPAIRALAYYADYLRKHSEYADTLNQREFDIIALLERRQRVGSAFLKPPPTDKGCKPSAFKAAHRGTAHGPRYMR